MTQTLAATWLSAVLLVTTVVAPVAQTATSPPPAAPGGTAPTGTKPGTTLLDRRRNDAAKLAGMVRFVAASCPQAKPDYDRFKQVVAALGVELKDLEGGELMVRSIDYAQVYQKDGAESCRKAEALFGAAGTVVPGLIVPATPAPGKP